LRVVRPIQKGVTQMRSSQKKVLFGTFLVLLVVAIYNMFAPQRDAESTRVGFDTLWHDVNAVPPNIRRLSIGSGRWSGAWTDGRRCVAKGPSIDATIADRLDRQRVPYSVVDQEETSFATLLMGSWLPMIAFLVMFWFVFRRASQAGAAAVNAVAAEK